MFTLKNLGLSGHSFDSEPWKLQCLLPCFSWKTRSQWNEDILPTASMGGSLAAAASAQCVFQTTNYLPIQCLILCHVLYDGSEFGGRFILRLCSRLEAGPASPVWQLRDCRRFVTRLRSTSRGWISSSVSSKPVGVGILFVAVRWGEASESALFEFCREKRVMFHNIKD